MTDVKLTPAQQSVVDHRGGALLVSAAAGSGKTKVLVDRMLAMVTQAESPCNIDDFLMITFTEAAASELRAKISKAIGEKLAASPADRHLRNQLSRIYLAQISTVHAFCAQILRDYAYLLDMPADFRIADETETSVLSAAALDAALGCAYADISAHPSVGALTQTLGFGRDDRRLGELVLCVYEKTQSYADPDEWMLRCREKAYAADVTDAGKTLWGAYMIRDLRQFIDYEESAVEGLIRETEGQPEFDGYRETLRDDMYTLTRLRALDTWDGISSVNVDFLNLKAIRNCENTALKTKISNWRKGYKAALGAKLEAFSGQSEVVLGELRSTAEALDGLFYIVGEFSRIYAARKRQRRVLDFSDLEHMTIRLLTQKGSGLPTAAAQEISMRYREIMVDEYQDTNQVQDTIFRAISRGGQNLFMVGDVKQSIYSFRLADPHIFLEKYSTYEATENPIATQPRKILLSTNFRSRGEILDAVNFVFSGVMSETVGNLKYGEEEALREGSVYPPLGEPAVELHFIDTTADDDADGGVTRDDAEAEFVAKRINELLCGEHYITQDGELRRIQPSDITILMRSLSTRAGIYTRALARRGISAVTDRGSSILETTEVQTLLSILRIADNAHRDIPLVGAMTGQIYRFTADEMTMIRAVHRHGDIFDAVSAYAEKDAKCAAFLSSLARLRDAKKWMDLPNFISFVYRETDILNVYGACEDGVIRRENLIAFRNLAMGATSRDIRDLPSFLRYVESLRERGYSVAANGAQNVNAVSIGTIHKSKGLEYPIVFLANLCGKFNTDDITKSQMLMDTELMGGCNVVDKSMMVQYPSIAKSAISIKKQLDLRSEELRILYVAMTRAKERLIMSCCQRYMDTALKNAADQASYPVSPYAASRVTNPAQWIMLAAASRAECQHLFGGAELQTQDLPNRWLVQYHCAASSDAASVPAGGVADLGRVVPHVPETVENYRFSSSVAVPAKLTATQLKGRFLDEESAGFASQASAARAEIRERVFAPGDETLTAAQKGTAMHWFMQYCRYENCGSEADITTEIARLRVERFLSPKQADSIDAHRLWGFFGSELGKLVLSSSGVKREFKFSLLVDAADFYPDQPDGKIMLQGVIDCFLVEEDGITVIDYKTDYIAAGAEAARAEFYRGQMKTYCHALRRIYDLPVKRRILFFFATGEAVELS